ncbi:MAG: helix-turn-helix transcriptional regulator [Gemmatimonadales bacterium]
MPLAPFRYAERRPSDALLPWFITWLEFEVREGAPAVHHVPPDGCTSIMVAVAGPDRGMALVTGPWLEPLAVPVTPGTRYLGIRLRPGSARSVLGVPPHELVNRSSPAEPMLGPLADVLIGALVDTVDIDSAAAAMEGVFTAQIPHYLQPDPLADRAVTRLMESRGELAIALLAKELRTSERTLLRRFKQATGITPKQFARVRRLLAAAWQVVDGAGSWSEIAATTGYADQPHLHHDFVDLTGLRPEAFGARVRSTEHDQVRP